MTSLNINDIHLIVGVASSVICTLLGIRLAFPPYYKAVSEYKSIRPLKYIAARRALGIAYILIGTLSFVQLFFLPIQLPYTKEDFFPIIALLISTSQIILFTVAALALINSKLVRRTVVLGNCYPILVLFVLSLLFEGQDNIQYPIRLVLFVYYVLQLLVYTIVFFIERRKYLNLLEDYFGVGKHYDAYKFRGLVALYICSIGIGIWALCSYFFTHLVQEILFVSCYTVFYILNAAYFLWYSKHSQRIQDVTSPENWEMTEEDSRIFAKNKEKKRKRKV